MIDFKWTRNLIEHRIGGDKRPALIALNKVRYAGNPGRWNISRINSSLSNLMLFNKRENVIWPIRQILGINHYWHWRPSSEELEISCEMIDGYVRYSSPRITGNHGLAAVCFAVNDFPFMTLKAHQCVSFDEIQRFDHRQNTANSNPMQITPFLGRLSLAYG